MKTYQKLSSPPVLCIQEGNAAPTLCLVSEQKGKKLECSLGTNADYGSHLILLQRSLMTGGAFCSSVLT